MLLLYYLPELHRRDWGSVRIDHFWWISGVAWPSKYKYMLNTDFFLSKKKKKRKNMSAWLIPTRNRLPSSAEVRFLPSTLALPWRPRVLEWVMCGWHKFPELGPAGVPTQLIFLASRGTDPHGADFLRCGWHLASVDNQILSSRYLNLVWRDTEAWSKWC